MLRIPNLKFPLWLALGGVVLAGGFNAVSHAEERSIQLAQSGYFDIYVDDRGRRFLVDPDTGRIVGRAKRQREASRSQRLRSRLRNRRLRLERELGRLFDLDEPEHFDERDELDERELQRRVQPRRNRNRNFNRNEQRPAQREIERRALPSINNGRGQDEELARLPDPDGAVQNRNLEAQGLNIAKPKLSRIQIASLQVVLDRNGYSPGVIDGAWGSNVAKAVAAWREANKDAPDITLPRILDEQIAATGGNPIVRYTITPADIRGPFVASVPVDYARKAQLQALSYTSPLEMLAERFHMSQGYLQKLNPGKNFSRAGTTIQVVAPGKKKTEKVHYVVADKRRKQVRAYGRNGNLVAAYPATIGSASTPSPTGTHSVARIAFDPEYTYNPKINFQQGSNTKILRIPPGPNGPVGSVWIALSKPTYGIHGTPNPETIGKTNSHGCIRLTNWDAQELAKLVQKGATVEFVE